MSQGNARNFILVFYEIELVLTIPYFYMSISKKCRQYLVVFFDQDTLFLTVYCIINLYQGNTKPDKFFFSVLLSKMNC